MALSRMLPRAHRLTCRGIGGRKDGGPSVPEAAGSVLWSGPRRGMDVGY